MHLAAQAAVRYAMENTVSYLRSNIAELTLLPSLIDIPEKYLNLKSKRQIVKMPRDADVPFPDANNISSAQV
ncbi:unnamed protein product [Sphagnum troendelagicum]